MLNRQMHGSCSESVARLTGLGKVVEANGQYRFYGPLKFAMVSRDLIAPHLNQPKFVNVVSS